MKKNWILLIKGIISLVLLIWLIGHYGLNPLKNLFVTNDVPFLISVLISLIIIQPAAVMRWQVFLKRSELSFTFRQLLSINYRSIFIGSLLPSSDGFAIIRAYLAEKLSSESKGKVSGTIIMEKITGLTVLLLTALIANLMLLSFIHRTRFLYAILVLLFLPFLFIGIVLKFKIPATNKLFDFVFRIKNTLKENIHGHTLLKALPWVLLVQFLSYFCIIFLFRAFNLHLSLLIHLSLIPLIQISSLLPVSISGIGVRESAFVYFYSLYLSNPSIILTISLLSFVVLTIIPALLGGCIILYNSFLKLNNGSNDV